jgi:hypothetical protein
MDGEEEMKGKTMRFTQMIVISAATMLWVSTASGAELFYHVGTGQSGGAAGSTTTFSPALPIKGSGTVDVAAGTYSVSLPTNAITIDVDPQGDADATLTTTGWSQTGTFTPVTGGAMTGTASGGSTTCIDDGGAFGALICIPYGGSGGSLATVTWPPTGASGDFGAPGANIDVAGNLIVVTEPFDAGGGQIQNYYRYAVNLPTLSEWGTMALGLMLLMSGMIPIIMNSRREQLPTA